MFLTKIKPTEPLLLRWIGVLTFVGGPFFIIPSDICFSQTYGTTFMREGLINKIPLERLPV
jgi:hypothetical protein